MLNPILNPLAKLCLECIKEVYDLSTCITGISFKLINEVISSVLVYVDCEDVPKLKQFYEEHGFQRFENGDHGEYICYVIPTKTVISEIEKLT